MDGDDNGGRKKPFNAHLFQSRNMFVFKKEGGGKNVEPYRF